MKHKNQKSNQVPSAEKDPVAFWAQHRKDTMAAIEGRIRPEVFRGRYGYLPRIVQRRLNRGFNGRRRLSR